jgi:hypothetical protein
LFVKFEFEFNTVKVYSKSLYNNNINNDIIYFSDIITITIFMTSFINRFNEGYILRYHVFVCPILLNLIGLTFADFGLVSFWEGIHF